MESPATSGKNIGRSRLLKDIAAAMNATSG
jgi:hypothetical protein